MSGARSVSLPPPRDSTTAGRDGPNERSRRRRRARGAPAARVPVARKASARSSRADAVLVPSHFRAGPARISSGTFRRRTSSVSRSRDSQWSRTTRSVRLRAQGSEWLVQHGADHTRCLPGPCQNPECPNEHALRGLGTRTRRPPHRTDSTVEAAAVAPSQ